MQLIIPLSADEGDNTSMLDALELNKYLFSNQNPTLLDVIAHYDKIMLKSAAKPTKK